MKFIFKMSFILILWGGLSCIPETTLDEELLPIVYIGVDTITTNDLEEDFCVYTNELFIINDDSIQLHLSQMPFAPIDSPYSFHGNARIYHGKIKQINQQNILKVKWDSDLPEALVCDENKGNTILLKNKKTTLIDLTKDTLCIRNIKCVKQ